MTIFILLTFKYVEVTYRFPQGGGVVTVVSRKVVPIAKSHKVVPLKHSTRAKRRCSSGEKGKAS
jgi:hypothetical protein